MTNVKLITGMGSLVVPDNGAIVSGSIIVEATYVDEGRIYALKLSNGPTQIINEKSAARLVKELARDLYETGHITPGEITDHMLRSTED